MKFITTLMSVLSIVPQMLSLIDQVVVNVEHGLGQIPGITGSQKLAAAEAKVNSFLKDAIADVKVLGMVTEAVKPLINAAVAAFNAAGLFTHKASNDAGENGSAPPASGAAQPGHAAS